MASTAQTVTFSCRDPYALAQWWARVLDGRLSVEDEPGDPAATVLHRGTPLLFLQVDDLAPRSRVHLDLAPTTTREQEVERLLELGASLVADRRRPDGTGWVVLADPEGNELCVVRSAADRGRPLRSTGDREWTTSQTAGERAMLDGMLAWYREGVLAKVEGLGPDEALAPRVRSGTTIAGLVQHLALVEDVWWTHRVAQQPLPEPWSSLDWDADPDADFSSADDLEVAVERYRAACARARDVAAGAELDDVVRFDGREVSVRFVLLHLVEETARHLGHLDVLCEQADGRTGE